MHAFRCQTRVSAAHDRPAWRTTRATRHQAAGSPNGTLFELPGQTQGSDRLASSSDTGRPSAASRHCHSRCGGLSRDALPISRRIDLGQGVSNTAVSHLDCFATPTQSFQSPRIQHAARVDHEVGGIEDSDRAQTVSVLRLGQLVVRTSGNDATTESWDRAGVQGPTESAGRVHVAHTSDRLLPGTGLASIAARANGASAAAMVDEPRRHLGSGPAGQQARVPRALLRGDRRRGRVGRRRQASTGPRRLGGDRRAISWE